MRNQKGSVTILIIIAVFALGGILTYTVLTSNDNKLQTSDLKNKEQIVGESETEDSSQEVKEEKAIEEEVVVENEVIEEPVVETVPSSPPYPLKEWEEYPLIDEIKNHELFDVWKEKGGRSNEVTQKNVDQREPDIIQNAYEDLKNTEDIEYKDYDWQDTLFKEYLEKRYSEFINTWDNW